MATFKLVLRDDKLRTDGNAPVYLRITENRRSSYTHTNVWITPSHWNPNTQKVRRPHPNEKKLNDDLTRQKMEAQDAYLTLKQRGKVTSKAIKNAVQGTGASSLLSYTEAYAASWKQKSYQEFKKVNVLLNKLRAYWKRKDLQFSDVDRDFILGFDTFMREEYGNVKSTRQVNLRILKGVFKRAVQDGVVPASDDPFVYYKIGASSGSREKLPFEKIQAMERLDLPEGSRLDLARDLFLFSFYAHGVRFGDLISLRWKNVVDGELTYVMMKNGKEKAAKLKDVPLGILEKHRPQCVRPDAFIFPVLAPDFDYSDPFFHRQKIASANAPLNGQLKLLAPLIKTDVNITFHVARHSFANYARSKSGDVYAVSKALMHSKLATTQTYLDSMDQSAVDRLTDAIFD